MTLLPITSVSYYPGSPVHLVNMGFWLAVETSVASEPNNLWPEPRKVVVPAKNENM